MQIPRKSLITGKIHILDLPVTHEQFMDYRNGAMVQDAFPDLDPAWREYIVSGITPEEWQEFIAAEAADDYHGEWPLDIAGNPLDPDMFLANHPDDDPLHYHMMMLWDGLEYLIRQGRVTCAREEDRNWLVRILTNANILFERQKEDYSGPEDEEEEGPEEEDEDEPDEEPDEAALAAAVERVRAARRG